MAVSPQLSAVLSALYAYPILLALGPVALVIVFTAHSYYRLSHVPGPFLASLTNISRLSWVVSNRAHDIHTALHRQYGPLVRFGPNMVSVGDPAEVGNIYRFMNPWLKVSLRRCVALFRHVRQYAMTACGLTSNLRSVQWH